MGRWSARAIRTFLLLLATPLVSTRGTSSCAAVAFVWPLPPPQQARQIQTVETYAPSCRNVRTCTSGRCQGFRPDVQSSSIDSGNSRSTTSSPSPSSTNSERDLAEQVVVRVAIELRQGMKKKPGTLSVRTLERKLEAALRQGSLLMPPSTTSPQLPSDVPTEKEDERKSRQLRTSTRKLLVALIRDLARFNIVPSFSFWHVLSIWLSPPLATLSISELATLTLALATLDVPEGSKPLLDAVLHAVCTHKKPPPHHFSTADGKQLCKALTLLQRPGGTFRAGSTPLLSWLLDLLQARDLVGEGRDAAATAATGRSIAESTTSSSIGRRSSSIGRSSSSSSSRSSRRGSNSNSSYGSNNSSYASSSGSSSDTRLVRRPLPLQPIFKPMRRQTALTSSVLHRRVADLLTSLGFACETEVGYGGLNLDLVLYPPPLPPAFSSLLPLIIEIDGPQHFVHGDPTRPTGATAARRRLLRSQYDLWAGLVAITYADEEEERGREGGIGRQGRRGRAARLLDVVERKVREDGGIELAMYRADGIAPDNVITNDNEAGKEDEQKEKWDVAKRLFLASSPEKLLDILRDDRNAGRLDATHWATALARMSEFVKHHYHQHHRRDQSNSTGKKDSSNDSSYDTSSTGKKKSDAKGSIAKKQRRGWYMGPEGVLRDVAHARELLQQSTFPALALMVEGLSDYYDFEKYGKLEEEDEDENDEKERGRDGVSDALNLANMAVSRVKVLQRGVKEEEKEKEEEQQQQQHQGMQRNSILMTSSSLVTLLRALSKLGYRSPSSLPVSSTILQGMARHGQLDSAALASVVDSLATIYLQRPFHSPAPASSFSSFCPSSLPDDVSACLTTLLRSGESQLHDLRPRDLVSFVSAMALFKEASQLCPSFSSSSSSTFSSSSSPAAAVAAADEERLIAAIVGAAGKDHICQTLPLADLALLTYKGPAEGDGEGGIISQRGRRKSLQWPLVGEVRRRLRALSPSALVSFMQQDMAQEDMVPAAVATASVSKWKTKTKSMRRRPRPTRAFLIMLTNELYKQRTALTAREKSIASVHLRGWADIYDAGPRFWQRFE